MRGAQGQRHHLARVRRCTVAPALVPQARLAPTPPSPLARRLGDNELCGLGTYSGGTYTTEGITELCKGLRGSAVTSLECAAAP